jgi:DNA-binding XRE family transcriptional regulator
MEFGPQECSPTINLNRVTAKGRSRKQDALRRLFSTPSSPEAKAEIAARFKALRREAILSQSDLGDLIGICRQSVSEIENCRVWSHYTTLNRFSDLEASHEQARLARLPRFPKHWR